MKAFIFAAGLGTRLKPLTDRMPKALVPVAGRPLLEHVIVKLKTCGVEAIIINLHHFPEQIMDFVRSRQSFGMQIAFSDERSCLLDTGGGLRYAASFFDDGRPFFVHNVDILSDVDLQEMYSYHLQTRSLSTLYVSDRMSSRYLLFDETECLCAWINEQTGEMKPAEAHLPFSTCRKYAFNGIHVISPEIFSRMNGWSGNFSIIDFYLSIAKDTAIRAFVSPNSRVIDVGKVEALREAEILLTK
ncbi:MAG: nucleotidyltransferase family protein [Dysgonamonadaceae bacterium]|jgi:NDP-sugar pyrophosphorylase family protein|nr:nucleotidyltransferase family protein [Dysgonamonadaceae bacterium]